MSLAKKKKVYIYSIYCIYEVSLVIRIDLIMSTKDAPNKVATVAATLHSLYFIAFHMNSTSVMHQYFNVTT